MDESSNTRGWIILGTFLTLVIAGGTIWGLAFEGGSSSPTPITTSSTSTPITPSSTTPTTMGPSSPAIYLSAESAPPGATVEISGKGFEAGETVALYIGAIEVGSTTADQGGGFSAVAVSVPEFYAHFTPPVPAGSHASGQSSDATATAPFEIG